MECRSQRPAQVSAQSKTERPQPSHQHPSHLVLLPKRKKGSRMHKRTFRGRGAPAEANTPAGLERVGTGEEWYKQLGYWLEGRGEGRSNTRLRFGSKWVRQSLQPRSLPRLPKD